MKYQAPTVQDLREFLDECMWDSRLQFRVRSKPRSIYDHDGPCYHLCAIREDRGSVIIEVEEDND